MHHIKEMSSTPKLNWQLLVWICNTKFQENMSG